MKLRKLVTGMALGAALIGGSLAATPALAQHWHGGVGYGGYGGWHGGYHGGWRGGYYGPGLGVYIGPGFFPGDYYGYGYPYAYGYGYPPVVVNSAPSTYVEQGSDTTAQPQQNFWYRCDGANGGYYPYVKQCPGGWQKETPHAPQ